MSPSGQSCALPAYYACRSINMIKVYVANAKNLMASNVPEHLMYKSTFSDRCTGIDRFVIFSSLIENPRSLARKRKYLVRSRGVHIFIAGSMMWFILRTLCNSDICIVYYDAII